MPISSTAPIPFAPILSARSILIPLLCLACPGTPSYCTALGTETTPEAASRLNALGRIQGEEAVKLLHDRDVSLVYRNGKKLSGVRITAVETANGAIRYLTVKNARSRSGRKLRAQVLRSLTVDGRDYELRPNETGKEVYLTDKQRRDEED